MNDQAPDEETDLTEFKKTIDQRFEKVEKQFIQTERRPFLVFFNLFKYRNQSAHRMEALKALLSWFFLSARGTATVASLGLAGFIAVLIALEANEIAYVQNELTEGNRRASTNIELTNILDQVQKEADPYTLACRGEIEDKEKQQKLIEESKCYSRTLKNENLETDKDMEQSCSNNPRTGCVPKNVPVSPVLQGRISGLLQALKPYRFLEENPDGCEKTVWFEKGLNYVKSLLFSQSYSLGCQKLSDRLSPERGQVLLALMNSGITVSQQSSYTFDKSYLNGVNFEGKDLKKIKLSGATLREANLIHTDLIGADLQEAVLSKSNFMGSKLSTAKLMKTDLTGADLTSIDLTKADLTDADLSNVNLRNANLMGAHLSNANLSNSNLIEADLRNSKMYRADLMQADLMETDLTSADLSTAYLVDADLRGAKLFSTDLNNAYLNNAYLTNAYLMESNLKSAYLISADLTDTDLTNADLSNADLTGTNLINSNLMGANLTKTILIGTNFKKAKYNKDTIFPEGFVPQDHGMILVDDETSSGNIDYE